MKPTSLTPLTTESREFGKSHKELILSATEIQLLQMHKSLVNLLWLLPRERDLRQTHQGREFPRLLGSGPFLLIIPLPLLPWLLWALLLISYNL